MAEAFQPRFVDLVRNTTRTTGTGNFVLGAALSGFTSFAAAVLPGERFYYSAIGVEKPSEREVGRGTMQPDGSISREPIGGALTDFTAGTKTVALVAAAEWFDTVQAALGGSGGGAGVAAVESRQALSEVQRRDLPAVLGEAGREGIFQFGEGDLSAMVAADTGEGIYVAPASDPSGASGAWVRTFEGPVSVRWFGLVEGSAGGANGTANSDAVDAALRTLRARAVNANGFYQGLESLRFPTGNFELARTIDLTDGTLILEGADTGFPAGRGTQLKFLPGVTGIRVQRYNTSAAGVSDAVAHRGGDGAVIRNLSLIGGFGESKTEAEAHGIQLRARARIENVFVDLFEGDGLHCSATAGGTPEGNANNCFVNSCRFQRCRHGMHVDGADANIWTVIALDVTANRGWGIWDSSFLGNTYVGCHSAANGTSVEGTPSASVHHGGRRYCVIAGQEAGAALNPPSGTAADNNWWVHIGTGGSHPSFPDWASGTEYRAGGSYHTDNANARNLLDGCYHESGQGLAQIVSPSLVVGGMLVGQTRGSGVSLGASGSGYLETNRGYRFTNAGSSSTTQSQLGDGSAQGILLYFNDSVAAPLTHRLKYSGNDLVLDYQNAGTRRAFLISGPATAQQFGAGAAVTEAFHPYKLMVGDTLVNARQITNSTAAPASGSFGAGSFSLDRGNSPTKIGRKCIAGGSPGTWSNELYALEVKLTVGPTAPASPALNDLWVDTN